MFLRLEAHTKEGNFFCTLLFHFCKFIKTFFKKNRRIQKKEDITKLFFNGFSYPMHPPVVRFLTKIIHPNVSRHGDVGIDIIQHNWSLALTISKLLLSVQSLLTDPFTQVE